MPTISSIMNYYRNEEIQSAVRAFGQIHEGKSPMKDIGDLIPDYLSLTAVMARVLKHSGLVEEEQAEIEGDVDPISGASPYCFLALPGMKRDLALPWVMSALGSDFHSGPEGLKRLLDAKATEDGEKILNTMTLIWETGKIYCAIHSQVHESCHDSAAEMLAKMLMGALESIEKDELASVMEEAKGATKQ